MRRASREEKQFAKQLGQRVSALRKARKLSQEELAELVEVHRNEIGYIERGLVTCSSFIVDKIARVLKVRADVLLPSPGTDPSPEQAALQDMVRQLGKPDAAGLARVLIEVQRYRHGEPAKPAGRKRA